MEFAGFRLRNQQYEAISPEANGCLESKELGLQLGIQDRKLRWFTAVGVLVSCPEEVEQQARKQVEQQAEQERQARERLETYLRSQGIDPEQL